MLGMVGVVRINPAQLRAAQDLRDNGFVPCCVVPSWPWDVPGRFSWAAVLARLRRRFPAVLESCRIGIAPPDPGIYRRALELLRARPEEAVLVAGPWGRARDLGIPVLRCRDADSALGQLQQLCRLQLLGPEEPLPVPCSPDDVGHGHVQIRPGLEFHFAELGQGPALCLCHGFPDTWRAWRFQLPALAEGGFRVLAPDMKGYGDSGAPSEIWKYSQEQLCKDFVTFLDKLAEGLVQVVLVGHDWGGALVWNLALFYPERVRAVCSLNTPFRPAQPGIDVMEKLESVPAFDYQLYFQQPGVAEAELEKDVERTLKILIRSSDPQDRLPVSPDFRRVRERGGP